METNKRPNRHSNPSKYHVRRNGSGKFIRHKNREVKEVLRVSM